MLNNNTRNKILRKFDIVDNKISNDNTHNTSNDVACLLYTSPSPRDGLLSRMPSSA